MLPWASSPDCVGQHLEQKTLTWSPAWRQHTGVRVIDGYLSFRLSFRHPGVMRAIIRGTRRLLSCLGVIVLLVAAVTTGILWLTLPPRSQQARIPGLTGPVDI